MRASVQLYPALIYWLYMLYVRWTQPILLLID